MNKNNITPDGLIKGIQSKNRELTLKNAELQTLSEKSAEAKRDYRVIKAQTILKLKSEGNPATLITEICKGDKVVAEAKFKSDVADGVYKACRESITDVRTAIDSYRSLLAWLKTEMHNAN